MTRILRSMLFVPANNWRMIVSALSGFEDAVILDLEDACPAEEKETGRIFARDSIPMFKERGIDVFVRVNSMATGLTKEDLSYVVVEGLDGIQLAKTESKEEIAELDKLLQEEEKKKGLKLGNICIIPLLESPKGVLAVSEIISTSPRVAAVSFGAGDFLRELGAGFAITRLTAEEYFPLILYARSIISLAAKVAGIPAIDTPFFGTLIDTEGLIKESQKAKLLGFSGKLLIHPRQVEPVNRVFTPSKEDIEFARQMMEAYEEAKARGLGAASFGGRMIDYAMYNMATQLLAIADTIAEKESKRRQIK